MHKRLGILLTASAIIFSRASAAAEWKPCKADQPAGGLEVLAMTTDDECVKEPGYYDHHGQCKAADEFRQTEGDWGYVVIHYVLSSFKTRSEFRWCQKKRAAGASNRDCESAVEERTRQDITNLENEAQRWVGNHCH
jgi:hypothetical protein